MGPYRSLAPVHGIAIAIATVLTTVTVIVIGIVIEDAVEGGNGPHKEYDTSRFKYSKIST